jgi:hypothetical protein
LANSCPVELRFVCPGRALLRRRFFLAGRRDRLGGGFTRLITIAFRRTTRRLRFHFRGGPFDLLELSIDPQRVVVGFRWGHGLRRRAHLLNGLSDPLFKEIVEVPIALGVSCGVGLSEPGRQRVFVRLLGLAQQLLKQIIRRGLVGLRG